MEIATCVARAGEDTIAGERWSEISRAWLGVALESIKHEDVELHDRLENCRALSDLHNDEHAPEVTAAALEEIKGAFSVLESKP